MYTKPDFIRVDLNIEDNFSSYKKKCDPDFDTWFVEHVYQCMDELQDSVSYLDNGWEHQCYANEYPA